jgi:hypothetical protein
MSTRFNSHGIRRNTTVAKKKADSSTKSKSASGSAHKSSAKAGDRKSSKEKKSAADDKNGMSDEQIGHVAGEVWQLLSANGGLSLATVKKAVDGSPDLILAAIGWLAREGKLEFASSGRSQKISLR